MIRTLRTRSPVGAAVAAIACNGTAYMLRFSAISRCLMTVRFCPQVELVDLRRVAGRILPDSSWFGHGRAAVAGSGARTGNDLGRLQLVLGKARRLDALGFSHSRHPAADADVAAPRLPRLEERCPCGIDGRPVRSGSRARGLEFAAATVAPISVPQPLPRSGQAVRRAPRSNRPSPLRVSKNTYWWASGRRQRRQQVTPGVKAARSLNANCRWRKSRGYCRRAVSGSSSKNLAFLPGGRIRRHHHSGDGSTFRSVS